MNERIVTLAGAKAYQDSIAQLAIGQPLELERFCDGAGRITITTTAGIPIGSLTRKSPVVSDIIGGASILHATVNSIKATIYEDEIVTVNARIVTGGSNDSFVMPPIINRSYSVGLVGESNYQSEVRACRLGDIVTLRHEPDNVIDRRAIMALHPSGKKVGYLPRDGWLTDAILDEGQEVRARIKSIASTQGGYGIVLEVDLRRHVKAMRS